MTLLFIYGPPAAGKLTVAKELAKLTGYKIFHNQLTVDLLTPFFEFGTESFYDLNQRIRLLIFEAAAKQKIPGLIFTFCYVKPLDDFKVRSFVKVIRKNGGRVYFVQIYCERKELLSRVKHSSRECFGKVKNPAKLKSILDSRDFFSPVPFRENLSIDNTKISGKKVAQMIIKHYKL